MGGIFVAIHRQNIGLLLGKIDILPLSLYTILKRGGSMAYISVADAAKKWNLSERSVRNYCAIGKNSECSSCR